MAQQVLNALALREQILANAQLLYQDQFIQHYQSKKTWAPFNIAVVYVNETTAAGLYRTQALLYSMDDVGFNATCLRYSMPANSAEEALQGLLSYLSMELGMRGSGVFAGGGGNVMNGHGGAGVNGVAPNGAVVNGAMPNGVAATGRGRGGQGRRGWGRGGAFRGGARRNGA